ncbi:MAG: tRNA lysidine(34) synthetase TilS [Bacteroidales bacterium]|jgi:tRNA(Ile)-lysidine synthase|nr:tRNA lysidine(34) synthetase TilS [Bacteroidales bacterium]
MTMNSDAHALPQQFDRYIGTNALLPARANVLAAVSGGIDSMVMMHLLHRAGVTAAVAHCNFSLRGEESDGDEALVREQAAAYHFPFHTVRFNTKQYAAQHGISIQMAARELRYRWFDELAAQHGYSRIAIAHNSDDRIETLFINLARGTGIKGLTSIQARNGNIIRPLLFASRSEITDYATQEHIAFREDSSNASDKYARNHIRHHLIPGMEGFFPAFRKTMERDMENLAGVEAFYREAVERYSRQVSAVENGLCCIDIAGLLESPSPQTLLHELLQPYGFPDETADELLQAPFRSGRQFFSPSHRLLCDRKQLMIQRLDESPDTKEYPVDLNMEQLPFPNGVLSISRFDMPQGYKPDRSPSVACMDADRLSTPLLLRKWRTGDRFRPLGMKQMKKLSDFFTDSKLSLIEKDNVWVLTAAGEIAWIAGYRIDDRYKITEKTTKVVRLANLI